MLVQEIFKFENGENEEEIQGVWPVETIFLNRSVIYANEPLAVVVLPADLEFALSVLVTGTAAALDESTGFVTITEAGMATLAACRGVTTMGQVGQSPLRYLQF